MENAGTPLKASTIIAEVEAQIAALASFPECREKSIAITQLQTGILWLKELDRRFPDQ